jgi:uncharacterized protein (DUF1015 family)
MTLFKPFKGLRPTPQSAGLVAAPPYDVLNTQEARALASANPLSFLHISKPEIDFPPGIDPCAPEVYAKGASSLAAMIKAGALIRDAVAAYYIVRIEQNGHVQTGIGAAASIAAYNAGRIRKHELTKPDKEEDRANQIEGTGAQTGPVMAVHRQDAAVAASIDEVTQSPADFSLTMAGGATHTLWTVSDPALKDRITDAFEGMAALYIADGHHRSAAAARVAERRGGDGNASWDRFLLFSFPDREVQILDYNRVVKDLAGLTAAEFLARLEDDFTVEAAPAPVRPKRAGEFGLYLDGGWRRLTLKQKPAGIDPVGRLDIAQLTKKILEPVLGIGDVRRDPRIDFIGGARGLEGLMERVDGGGWGVAFSLYPTSLADLMDVADAGGVMPPKSTWFEPKLADGLVSLVLD